MATKRQMLKSLIATRQDILAIERAEKYGIPIVYTATTPPQPAIIIKAFTDSLLGDFASHEERSPQSRKQPYYQVTHIHSGRTLQFPAKTQSANQAIEIAIYLISKMPRATSAHFNGAHLSTPEQRRQQILDASE